MSNLIDFQAAKARREAEAHTDVLDTHDAVLDLSDVVLTTDDMVSTCNIHISEDTIIFSPKETEET